MASLMELRTPPKKYTFSTSVRSYFVVHKLRRILVCEKRDKKYDREEMGSRRLTMGTKIRRQKTERRK